MINKPILIVPGDINTIFYEILFKSLKNKINCPIILITSKKIFINKMKKFSFKRKIEFISNVQDHNKLSKNSIYLMNVDYEKKNYLDNCFKEAFKVLENGFTNKFINGPVNKTKFLNKKFLGITEYVSKRFSIYTYC